ncbi:MAG: hypothetical protein NE327_13760 [Lentisphaeraceae bacterium]|nr:hypothetical protein [Lentisphaeraceae bacterium]
MIFYYCPDSEVKSAGIRRLYEHVHVLIKAGFNAAVLHNKADFRRKDLPDVEVKGLDQQGILKQSDTVVFPEGFPGLMSEFKDIPVRKMVICLSWTYVFGGLPERVSWRDFGIERIIGDSEYTTEMVGWAMNLPSHCIVNQLNDKLYYKQPLNGKKKKVVFISRKGQKVPLLLRVLHTRNPDFINKIQWVGLDGLNEDEFAGHVREASIFLNMSEAEGLAHSCFEAMRSGTLLCGYSSIGGQRVFIGGGDEQNAVIAETGDYLSLAWLMEPLLEDLLNDRYEEWQSIADKAYKDTLHMTSENFESQLVSFWKKVAPGEMRAIEKTLK